MSALRAEETTDTPAVHFRTFGGAALGLHLARALAGRYPQLWVASFATARLDQPPGQRLPAELVGHEIVLKPSGLHESFTPHASRGAHGRYPRLTLSTATTWDDLFGEVDPLLPDGTVALVAQRIVTADGWPEPVIVHADGLEVRIEFANGAARWLMVWRPDEPATLYGTVGDDGPRPGWCIPVARLHHQLVHALRFPVNTEGVVSSDGRFGVVQLRPVPEDVSCDPVLTCEIADLIRRGAVLRHTPFVWAAFDITVDGVALADGSDPRVMLRRLPETGGTPNREPLSAGNTTPPSQRLLVDLTGGFHLSHAVEHLPPPGPERAAFRYLGLPGLALDTLVGRTVRLVSDGRTGAVVVT